MCVDSEFVFYFIYTVGLIIWFKTAHITILTVIVLLDLSKAFDSIDHRQTLNKAKSIRPKPWRLRMVQKLLDRNDAAGEDWLSCVRTMSYHSWCTARFDIRTCFVQYIFE